MAIAGRRSFTSFISFIFCFLGGAPRRGAVKPKSTNNNGKKSFTAQEFFSILSWSQSIYLAIFFRNRITQKTRNGAAWRLR
jgi:hypothetical protein